MPTKRYYYDSDGVVSTCSSATSSATGACDDVNAMIYDREEQFKTTPPGFSPPPPAGKPGTVCWEANVLTFNGGNALASTNNVSLTTSYVNGWMDLSFPVASSSIYQGNYHELPMTSGVFQGLPIIGFAAQTFLNGNADRQRRQAHPVELRRHVRPQVQAFVRGLSDVATGGRNRPFVGKSGKAGLRPRFSRFRRPEGRRSYAIIMTIAVSGRRTL
jgi:hypothetical protein